MHNAEKFDALCPLKRAIKEKVAAHASYPDIRETLKPLRRRKRVV